MFLYGVIGFIDDFLIILKHNKFDLNEINDIYGYQAQEEAYDYVSVDKGSGWLLYDIKTGDTFCAKISNKDWSSEISYKYLTFDGCDAYTAYLKLEAFDLVEALEAGELSGELKTIAEGLKEDDNPVLMVMKFKE